MFVVRIELFNHEVSTTNKAENKKLGRHSGASPSVLLLPRNNSVRSDRPSIYNQNLFIMRTERTEKTATGQSAKEPALVEILTEFFSQQPAEAYKEELWHWYVTALSSDDMNDWTASERTNLVALYEQLTKLIDQLDTLNQKIQEPCKQQS